MQHIIDVVKAMFGIVPKPQQVETLYNLAFRGKDTILIAKTGFGKSLIFQSLPIIIGHQSTSIIVMPLLELEAEQGRKIQDIPDCRPFVLDGRSNTAQNRDSIRDGQYTHGM